MRLTAPALRICEATFEYRVCDTEMLTRFLTRLLKLAQAAGNSALVGELDRCIELFRQQRTLRQLYQ